MKYSQYTRWFVLATWPATCCLLKICFFLIKDCLYYSGSKMTFHVLCLIFHTRKTFIFTLSFCPAFCHPETAPSSLCKRKGKIWGFCFSPFAFNVNFSTFFFVECDRNTRLYRRSESESEQECVLLAKYLCTYKDFDSSLAKLSLYLHKRKEIHIWKRTVQLDGNIKGDV